MLISTEATTMPTITLSNCAPLTRLGLQYELFLARMSESDRIFFLFNDTAATEIYTLSLHDALPIFPRSARNRCSGTGCPKSPRRSPRAKARSEEHTSELQSHHDLVCRLLLEKK